MISSVPIEKFTADFIPNTCLARAATAWSRRFLAFGVAVFRHWIEKERQRATVDQGRRIAAIKTGQHHQTAVAFIANAARHAHTVGRKKAKPPETMARVEIR
ncbi:hypothetical protein ASG68_29260 [Rhizobium sp. Leaf453]|nr:hypothetical protein ASG50_15630 [Rhizobium sp. Leaf386]KQT05062.1 hypothetical protein ASG42_21280 [Rhizobium sp. Leaf391]KQU00972.1 hypothetical protein ASG68_29260 [Rhizobium sp. Leaf453]